MSGKDMRKIINSMGTSKAVLSETVDYSDREKRIKQIMRDAGKTYEEAAKIYDKVMNNDETKEINEGTWSVPNTTAKALELAELLKSPIPASQASDVLYNSVGDDELFDSFGDYEPDEDVRVSVCSTIQDWLANPRAWRVTWDKEAKTILQNACNEYEKTSNAESTQRQLKFVKTQYEKTGDVDALWDSLVNHFGTDEAHKYYAKITTIGESTESIAVATLKEYDYMAMIDDEPDDIPQFNSLNDVLPAGDTQVWYGNKYFFRDASLGYEYMKERGTLPDVSDLKNTHSYLGSISLTDPEAIYVELQAENWSPHGEARTLISNLDDVWHTSMSMGDIVIINGKALMVDVTGFTKL